MPFLKISLDFRQQIDNFSQNLLTKLFMSSKRSESPLQNPIFGFFISLILVEISYFLFQTTPSLRFQITTFILVSQAKCHSRDVWLTKSFKSAMTFEISAWKHPNISKQGLNNIWRCLKEREGCGWSDFSCEKKIMWNMRIL